MGAAGAAVPCHAPPPLLLHWQGLADPVPYNNVTMANVSSPEHRALSGRAAREALVLLKNGGGERANGVGEGR